MNIKNFKGVFMRDSLPPRCSDNECFIYNLDSQNSDGTHWTCVFIDKNQGCYFDSYGHGPTLEIQNYMKDINNRFYNTFIIQSQDEIICGHYCLFVLLHLNNGYNFYEILNSLLKSSVL